MKNKNFLSFALLMLTVILAGCTGQLSSDSGSGRNSDLPHLRKEGKNTRLYVDGKPFLMLGGELHNSSTAGFEYMKPIWKRMADASLNTVIGAASWELVEPEEGKYDFTLVDSMITGARNEGLKLVVIWFASWKNGESTYAPEWVKKDPVRFPLVKDEKGKTLNILTTFGEKSANADAAAFAAMMKHIKKIDSKHHTVIMVQVENEMGTLRTKRDYSDIANTAFNGPVPSELIKYLEKNSATLYPGLVEAWRKSRFRKEGTWEEVFGKGELLEDWKDLSYFTEELFMAWNYGRYVEKVASSGKEKYNIPMYVNAWLKQPGRSGHAPGNYPSGGPTPQVLDIWRAAAPSIDFIAPDIYIVDTFRYVCEQYTLSGNPLFIPETTGDAASASRAFFTFGRFHALGYSPFGIDGADPGAVTNDLSNIKDSYSTLNQLSSLINQYSGTENMTGLLVDDNKRSDSVTIGGFKIKGNLGRRFGGGGQAGVNINGTPASGQDNQRRAGGAIIICTGPGEYYIAGRNMSINFFPPDAKTGTNVSFLSLEDGMIMDNQWITGRHLNGDEFRVIFPSDKSKIYKASLYTY